MAKFEHEHGVMYYEQIVGERPLLVYINGLGSDSTHFSFKSLASQLPFEQMFIDRLGAGYSDETVSERTIEQIVDELREFLQSFHTDLILVAHSIGGIYAARLLRDLPEVKGLIAIEPTSAVIQKYDQTAPYLAMQEKFQSIVDDLHDPAWTADDLVARRYFDEERSLETLGREIDLAVANVISNRDLQLTNEPILLFTQAYRQAEFEESEYATADMTLKIFEGSHYLHWHNAPEMAREIMTWISRL